MAAEPRRRSFFPALLSAGLLLWPAWWNGYPIVFADTGTYLSQAVHRYLGWDRPPFYSLFMLPLHLTISTWPVIVAQAFLTVWVLRLLFRALLPGLRAWWLPVWVLPLTALTWLPFLVSQLMPDLFTPLLVLLLCLLGLGSAPYGVREAAPGMSAWARYERNGLVLFAAFMIATQQSSVLLSAVIIAVLIPVRRLLRVADGTPSTPLLLPPVLAIVALLSVNAIGHKRASLSPYGNVFLLARVIYDGPGMTVLHRDCPDKHWRLCSALDRFPPTSDDFLWHANSPIPSVGGHKAVSADAETIIAAALWAEPGVELRAVLRNGAEQLRLFASGDGLEPWPAEVTPWIVRDFPPAESAAYAAAKQARGLLVLPPWLGEIHRIVALAGVALCLVLLPLAWRRRDATAGYLLVVLLAVPASALITGALSAPHDRYQSRIMWLPPALAMLSAASLRRRRV